MHPDFVSCIMCDLLLPLFVVAMLFAFAGVGAEVVVKAAASIAVALIAGVVKIVQSIFGALFKRWK